MAKNLPKQLPVDCVGHTDYVMQLACSKICESGYYLASASRDGQAMLRRDDTGDWVSTFKRAGDPMLSVCVSEDATLLATGSDDCTACVWGAISGIQLTKLMLSSPVRCVALCSRCEYLAVGCLDRANGHSSDNVLYVYAVEDQDAAVKFKGQARGVRDVLFCRNDRALLSSSHDRSIRLWDRLSGKQVHSIMLPHHAKTLEMCADGRTVTIAYGQSVIFLDVERFEILRHHKLPWRITGASLHPEKQTFVCGAGDRVFKFDYASGEIVESFSAHDSYVICVKYSPDGEVYASASSDGGLRLWQQTVGKK